MTNILSIFCGIQTRGLYFLPWIRNVGWEPTLAEDFEYSYDFQATNLLLKMGTSSPPLCFLSPFSYSGTLLE